MPTSEISDAVDCIARLCERHMRFSSPFHLAKCGGCGAPSFGQPCAVCSFYPYGSDKGTWHPHRADRALFCERVGNSVPGGQGNLASWYIASYRKTVAYQQSPVFRQDVEAAVAEALTMEGLPDAGTIWDEVSEGGKVLKRPTSSHEARVLWDVLFEVATQGDKLAIGMKRDLAQDIVASIHDGSDDRIADARAKLDDWLTEALAIAPKNGNLHFAKRKLDEIKTDPATPGPR